MGVQTLESCNKIEEYKKEVCSQIRWKRAHKEISKELEAHILDQRDCYVEAGEEESFALEKAIKEMGDPVMVGAQLDSIHRPKVQSTMIIFTVALVVLGLFIRIFLARDGYYTDKLLQQILSVGIGIGVMLLVYYGDFTIIGRRPKAIIWISLIAAVVVLSAERRVIMGQSFYLILRIPFSGAYLSLLFPLVLVAVIYSVRNKKYLGILLTEGALFAMAALVALFSSGGTTILFLITGLTLITVPICKGWYQVHKGIGCFMLYLTVGLSLIFILMNSPNAVYYINKLIFFIDPTDDPLGQGYMGVVIRTLIDNSLLIGKGFIPTLYENSFLFHSSGRDISFLLVFLIVHYGRIVLYLISIIMGIFLIKGFYQSLKQKSMLGLLVSLAVMITLTIQTFSYIAWNLGYMLASPISLPFISYGNTASIINLFLIGLMLSVFRNGDIVKDEVFA